MKRITPAIVIAITSLFFISCSDNLGESAATIAKKWCDLNGKVARALEGPEKEAAKAAREKYEDEIDEKYAKDEAMKRQIDDEVEKCEDASEGR